MIWSAYSMHLLILQIYTEMKHLQKLPTMECKKNLFQTKIAADDI